MRKEPRTTAARAALLVLACVAVSSAAVHDGPRRRLRPLATLDCGGYVHLFDASVPSGSSVARVYPGEELVCTLRLEVHDVDAEACSHWRDELARDMEIYVLRGLEDVVISNDHTTPYTQRRRNALEARRLETAVLTELTDSEELEASDWVLLFEVRLPDLGREQPGSYRIEAHIDGDGLEQCATLRRRLRATQLIGAVAVAGEPLGTTELLQWHYRSAAHSLHARRFDEAEGHLNEVLRLHPNSCLGHGLLGDLRRQQGRRVEARAAYDRAIELAEGRLDTLNQAFGLTPGAEKPWTDRWRRHRDEDGGRSR